jgi:hypothetical protein
MKSKKLMPSADAVEKATGLRKHPITITRWLTVGVSGVVLNSVLVGGRRMSTFADVDEFIAATTAARKQKRSQKSDELREVVR